MDKTVSICIPVFNESENIENAISSVERLFSEKLKTYSLEIIVTDNGSSDDTWEIIEKLSKSRPNLIAYKFSRNFGYQNSVFAGLSLATGDAIIELDADLQDPVEVIPEFIESWEEGYNVVYGIRTARSCSRVKKLAYGFFYKTMGALAELDIPPDAGDFRLIDRKVANVLKALTEKNLYLRGLISHIGFKQKAIYYQRNSRELGESKFSFKDYFIFAFDGITAFSKKPLRGIAFVGVILFFLSFGLGTYYLLTSLIRGSGAPGFPTTIIISLALHGINFIFLGIIGEYLSRIFDDAKNRPRVIISESINSEDPPLFL